MTTIAERRVQVLHELRFGDWVQIRSRRAPTWDHKKSKERCAVGVIAEALEVNPFVSNGFLGGALGTPFYVLADIEVKNDIDRFTLSEVADYLETWWKKADASENGCGCG